jgi:hypothetical protein
MAKHTSKLNERNNNNSTNLLQIFKSGIHDLTYLPILLSLSQIIPFNHVTNDIYTNKLIIETNNICWDTNLKVEIYMHTKKLIFLNTWQNILESHELKMICWYLIGMDFENLSSTHEIEFVLMVCDPKRSTVLGYHKSLKNISWAFCNLTFELGDQVFPNGCMYPSTLNTYTKTTYKQHHIDCT